MQVIAEKELVRACQILFGSQLQIDRRFLEYLQPAGVKKAYRLKALETHPDIFATTTNDLQSVSTTLFREVQTAYENLSHYLAAREKGFRFPVFGYGPFPTGTPTGGPRPKKANGKRGPQTQSENFGNEKEKNGGNGRYYRGWRPDTHFRGALPERELLLGNYLYYAGAINWNTMIQALVWQRRQRPRVGELARRMGWLTDDHIRFICRNRELFERFGYSAQRLGLLTQLQIKVLLFRQRCLQPKLGEYFVENEIITEEMLADLVRQCQEHNARIRISRFRSGVTC